MMMMFELVGGVKKIKGKKRKRGERIKILERRRRER